MKKPGLRKKKKSPLCSYVLVAIATLLFFGCGTDPKPDRSGTNESAEVRNKNVNSDSTGEKDKGENPQDVSDCTNPYYPLHTNSEREYKISGTAPATYVLSQKMRGGNGFTETRDFNGGMEVVSNWSCTDEGLRNADYNNSISTSNVNAKMETIESSGVTIPKDWEKGKKWRANYKIQAELLGKKVGGTVTIDNELVSLDDNVSVQGGDYVAARVDSVINVKLSLKDMKIPESKVTMSNWYARKVGLIKQEVKSGLADSSVEYAGEK